MIRILIFYLVTYYDTVIKTPKQIIGNLHLTPAIII